MIGLGFAAVAALLVVLGVFDSVLAGNFGQTVLASIAAFTVGTFATLLSQTVVVNANTATVRALRDPDRFAAKFTDLLRALGPQRVVIAIDNLDRCSPESAIEMLSTIKTYLEPAVGGESRPKSSAIETVDKQVVFVVSVDDQALRRHLVAKESERSRDEDQLAVRRYVDEYLAKFFSARLPIRAILPDDMRGYIAHHLEPLIEARDLEDDHARELINLVSAGLRRNPRRVKQFSNDLESRLRLLEERESQGEGRSAGIDPPVSDDVRMVAKLALIETEWPEAFELLEEHPPLLAQWEQLTETEDEIDWGAEDVLPQRDPNEHARGRQARRDFATFLGQARSVQTPHLRAMLRLKQSPEEVGLPGFTEFRAAATSGDRGRVEEDPRQDADADRDRLVARLPAILREEVDVGDLPAARAIVDLAVSIDAMEPFEGERRRILTFAANTVALRLELGLLNPAAVLAAAHLVPAVPRQHLYQPFVARFVDNEQDDERRRSAGAALGPLASELSNQQLDLIYGALADGPLREKFAVYREFAEGAPDQIPASAVRVASRLPRPLPTARSESSLLARPRCARDSYRQPSRYARCRAWPACSVAGARRPTGQHRDAAPLRRDRPRPRVARQARGSRGGVLVQLLQEIAANCGAYPGEAHPQIVDFIAELPSSRRGGLPAAGPSRRCCPALRGSPQHGLAVFEEIGRVPDGFKAALLDRLVALGADPNHWQAGTAALAKFAGEEISQRIAAAFGQLIAGGHLDLAAQVLDAYEDELRPQLTELADQAAPHLQERPETPASCCRWSWSRPWPSR